jgi:replicative DNA helicase
MSDLRESGQIEQDADLIGFLYPDPETKTDSLKPSDPRTIFFRIGKQRNGVRDFDIPLTFFPDIVTFETQARKSPPEK